MIPPEPALFAIDSPLLPLAQRELQVLADSVGAAPDYADLLIHMLNRREAVDSSQIGGTHTRFDELLLHEHWTKRRHRAFQAHQVMNILHTGIDAVLEDVATLRDYATKAVRRR